MKQPAVFLLLLVAALALRCSHAPVVPPGDPAALWRTVQAGYDRPDVPFVAEGTAGIESRNASHSVDFALRWESASRFRIDLTGPFGIALASAALVDTLAWVSVPLRGTYLAGPLALADSAAAASLNLSLDRIVRAVSGLPPRQDGEFLRAERGLKAFDFQFRNGDTIRTFTVDGRCADITGYRVRISDSIWAELHYGDFRVVDGARRPHRVKLSSPTAGMALDLAFDRIEPAKPFPAGVWRQSVPDGLSPQRFK
ncbi:MAG: hypothetical protein MUF78_06225 [Candidatus Edwardsbacteria bacterium]|jgi:hypothetical protein|nr:hypothetical protein [Candidatus Edwardsbacteria bacterium]